MKYYDITRELLSSPVYGDRGTGLKPYSTCRERTSTSAPFPAPSCGTLRRFSSASAVTGVTSPRFPSASTHVVLSVPENRLVTEDGLGVSPKNDAAAAEIGRHILPCPSGAAFLLRRESALGTDASSVARQASRHTCPSSQAAWPSSNPFGWKKFPTGNISFRRPLSRSEERKGRRAGPCCSSRKRNHRKSRNAGGGKNDLQERETLGRKPPVYFRSRFRRSEPTVSSRAGTLGKDTGPSSTFW